MIHSVRALKKALTLWNSLACSPLLGLCISMEQKKRKAALKEGTVHRALQKKLA
jgi:hypothetical protein